MAMVHVTARRRDAAVCEDFVLRVVALVVGRHFIFQVKIYVSSSQGPMNSEKLLRCADRCCRFRRLARPSSLLRPSHHLPRSSPSLSHSFVVTASASTGASPTHAHHTAAPATYSAAMTPNTALQFCPVARG